MRKTVILGLGLVLLGATWASAAITVESDPSIVYQQTENSPCVIGDMSCNQPKSGTGQNAVFFPATQVSGTPGGNNGSTYVLTSPTYIVGATLTPLTPKNADTPLSIIPSVFQIGVDENIAAGASGGEVLLYFRTYVNGVLSVANSFETDFAIPNLNNGNGFSDFILKGFSLTAGTQVYFTVSVQNDTDGMEEFFIIPQGTPTVPEPSALLLLGSGLVGLALYGRKAYKR